MKRPSPSEAMTIFVVFFGISLLDAFATRNWWRAGFWLVMGLVFFAAGRVPRR